MEEGELLCVKRVRSELVIHHFPVLYGFDIIDVESVRGFLGSQPLTLHCFDYLTLYGIVNTQIGNVLHIIACDELR